MRQPTITKIGPNVHVYAGLFVVSFSALALEVALVRLLSVTTWYHLAFFAISTAMLGGTAGAIRVYLRPGAFPRDSLDKVVSVYCVYLALSIPATLVMLCLIPLSLDKTIMSLLAMLATTVACAFPYYFVGTVVSATLTRSDLPIGRLYASDLIGASLGCLFVLGALEFLDVPSLILLCSCTAALAALIFAMRTTWRRRLLLAGLSAAMLAGTILNSLSLKAIRPLVLKGTVIEPAFRYAIDRWNSYSRVTVYPSVWCAPQYWGPSPWAPLDPVNQRVMTIDGGAATVMRRFAGYGDIEHLRYDVTNFAYHLGRKGEACIIGVGGGRDIQSALLFRQQHVTGVEINPIFIDLLEHEFRDFAGLAGRPDVTLVTAEARRYLSRDPKKYAVIQMSLTDTWASTGAGAFSLSENSLYTVEAWSVFFDRLADDGIFTVSRWHNPEMLGETGRLVALACGALLRQGIQDPSKHLALVSTENLATLLVSRRPFTQSDVDKIRSICRQYGFRPVLIPGQQPTIALLQRIVSARTYDDLLAATSGGEYDCSPTTDENPYFFNMLRLGHLSAAFAGIGGTGVLNGNLIATLTLIALLAMLLLTVFAAIVVPLLLRERYETDVAGVAGNPWWGAIYFSLIGGGFMLVEIALIQRLTVLLSHPTQALGILLFTIIASTGVGSLLSGRCFVIRPPWIYVYPLAMAALIVSVRFVLGLLLREMIAASLLWTIAASVAVIFPLGLLMGMFFPSGMRLAQAVCPLHTPWYWALNGIFGVLCSAAAVFISIYVSVSTNFYLAAGCYLAALVPLAAMCKQAGSAASAVQQFEQKAGVASG